MKLRYKILIVLAVVSTVYTIYTFPRDIICMKPDRIENLDIMYVPPRSQAATPDHEQRIVTDLDEIKTIIKIFNNYKFRKKVLREEVSLPANTELIIIFPTISEGKGSGKPIQFYSDGTICDGYNEYHIGLIGTSDARELFTKLSNYLKNQKNELVD